LHIPSGTYLAAASSQIAMDSEHWDTPEKYDDDDHLDMEEYT
jgi:hypothetical protein